MSVAPLLRHSDALGVALRIASVSRLSQLRSLCRSLAKRGWSRLFEYHGFDLTAADFGKELKKPLKIDRNRPGFEDFCLAGRRAIEPGDPARSLLYHALASPNVHPTPNGWPAPDDCYPSPKDLDVTENYIYALAPVKVSALDNFKIGVFAYEYRPAESTAHGYHADLVFSRTGIARVGTEKMAWDGPSRSFRPDPEGRTGISVCPSRFAAFLARAVNPDSPDPIMGRRDEQNDQIRTFYYPAHKLFAGADCIFGRAIDLRFTEYHRNEKLRRIHTQGKVKLAPGFDINASPFVRDSLNDRELVSLETCGASVLVVPKTHRRLIRVTMQKNAISGRKEIVRTTSLPNTETIGSGLPCSCRRTGRRGGCPST
jgi:hypothetical protein